jgi:hypothetical protein
VANQYASRRQIKDAGNLRGDANDARVDRVGEAASAKIERMTRRFFIPRTETRLYRFPQPDTPSNLLELDTDLLSVTTLKSEAQNSSPTTISSTDFFPEPNNPGVDGVVRYDRIEIDTSSSAIFAAGDTGQRSISVLGEWGYSAELEVLQATAAEAIDTSETDIDIDRSDQVGPGDTILIDSERMKVTDLTFIAPTSAALIDGALTKTQSQTAITVDTSHGIVAGEVVLIDSERMYVDSLTGATTLNVGRGYDGSVLAAHNDDAVIQVERRLTVVRSVNGSTAAAHDSGAAISRYTPPADVVELCVAEALTMYAQGGAQYGRSIGGVEGAKEVSGTELRAMRKRVAGSYIRPRIGVI